MWGDIAIAFLLAFITSFICTPYTIKLAKKVGALNVPSNRGVNDKPIPRIGGIAVILGFILSAIYLIITICVEGKMVLNDQDEYGFKLFGFFIGICLIGIFAYLDDIRNLKPWQKLTIQIIAAVIVYLSGIRINIINEIRIPEVISFILTVGWIVGITNAINLIDGLDGLSSGITLISCVFLLIIFATNYSPLISVILVTALAGSIMGFMPFNIHPAKTFIGDVGAQFLGFSLAVISILGVAKTVTLLVLIAPLLVLGLPIFDTVFAVCRRIIKGKSIKAVFRADKGHLHHRLMKKGYTQKQSVFILYAVSATLGMIAIILIDEGIWKSLSFLLIVIAIVAAGYKEIKKYKRALVRENIRLGLVRKEDLEVQSNNEHIEDEKT